MNTFSMAKTFADALNALDNTVKSKVQQKVTLFSQNPDANGLNYEELNTRDTDIYSIRVTDNYRVILKRPNGGNYAIFLYVDTHDKAYEWARRHTCDIDVNGSITVFETPEDVKSVRAGKTQSRLASLSDADFASMKIKPEYFEMLRTKVFIVSQLVPFKDYVDEASYLVLEEILKGLDKKSALALYKDLTDMPVLPTMLSPLFEYSSEKLQLIGIPADYINIVQGIKSVEELNAVQKQLPEIAMQNLIKLLNGEDIEVLIRDSKSGNKVSRPDDFKSASGNRGSKPTVYTPPTQEDIDKFFNMPMEKWRVFLHPDQRSIVEAQYNGPARVIGGAGTGKTVIIVHRAKELASECAEDEYVLVTTYSKTLAQDIYSRLKLICNASQLKHIQVKTLDSIINSLVQRYTKLHLKYNQAAQGFRLSPIQTAWKKACEAANYDVFDTEFYISEWRDVVQTQNISTLDDYVTAIRKGRGNRRLDANAKKSVWKVFEEYQKYMKEKSWIDADWAGNYVAEQHSVKHPQPTYKHILVDECQDFKAPSLRVLRALAGKEHRNDMFLAGDARQRIYDGHCSLKDCGILVHNRSSQITVNYRTTSEIYELAYKLQKKYNYDDLDGNPTSKDKCACSMHGASPKINRYNTASLEQNAVVDDIMHRLNEGFAASEMCIVAKKKKIADAFEELLLDNGIQTLKLTADQEDDKTIPGVRLSTMHRVKGMEFDCMYVVAVNKDLLPFATVYNNPDNDSISKVEIMKQDANLLSVSITRARKLAWISCYGQPSELFEVLQQE